MNLEHGHELKVGMWVDACDEESIWSAARISRIKRKKKAVTVHYIGWGPEWDEVISYRSSGALKRLATHKTYSMRFKCIVDLVDKDIRGNRHQTLLWPCIVNIRSPSPIASLEDYKTAQEGLKVETNIFVEPYGLKNKYLQENTLTKVIDGGTWIKVRQVKGWKIINFDKTDKKQFPLKFDLAYNLAKNDESVGKLPNNAFEKNTLLHKSLRKTRKTGRKENRKDAASSSLSSDDNKSESTSVGEGNGNRSSVHTSHSSSRKEQQKKPCLSSTVVKAPNSGGKKKLKRKAERSDEDSADEADTAMSHDTSHHDRNTKGLSQDDKAEPDNSSLRKNKKRKLNEWNKIDATSKTIEKKEASTSTSTSTTTVTSKEDEKISQSEKNNIQTTTSQQPQAQPPSHEIISKKSNTINEKVRVALPHVLEKEKLKVPKKKRNMQSLGRGNENHQNDSYHGDTQSLAASTSTKQLSNNEAGTAKRSKRDADKQDSLHNSYREAVDVKAVSGETSGSINTKSNDKIQEMVRDLRSSVSKRFNASSSENDSSKEEIEAVEERTKRSKRKKNDESQPSFRQQGIPTVVSNSSEDNIMNRRRKKDGKDVVNKVQKEVSIVDLFFSGLKRERKKRRRIRKRRKERESSARKTN